MFTIRIFEKGEASGLVRIWLVDRKGTALRELEDPIGHLPGAIDWEKTAASCRPIAGQGVEIDLVVEEKSDA